MNESDQIDQPLTLIGHPFATVGMGEQLRSYMGACAALNIEFGVFDVFRHAQRNDVDHRAHILPVEMESPPPGIRLFHINGDEIERVIEAFEARGGRFADGYNIIVPAWELPRYPREWAHALRKFDEVWAISRYLQESLATADIDSIHMGQPVEIPVGHFLPRKYFGLRESAFILLHFFDLSSYSARKNPDAVLAMFEKFRLGHSLADVQLVVKVKQGDEAAEAWLDPIRRRIPEAVCLAKPMTALETRSLVCACDCFVSLHRAEGFGRGLGEAMFLGKIALGTAWSGNLDFMTQETSLLVDHGLIPVGKDEYPFGAGQQWADPSVDHAVELLATAIAHPERTRAMADRGRREVRITHSFRAVGLSILDRLIQLRGAQPGMIGTNPSAVAVHRKSAKSRLSASNKMKR